MTKFTLTVADSHGYETGDLLEIEWGGETRTARIIGVQGDTLSLTVDGIVYTPLPEEKETFLDWLDGWRWEIGYQTSYQTGRLYRYLTKPLVDAADYARYKVAVWRGQTNLPYPVWSFHRALRKFIGNEQHN